MPKGGRIGFGLRKRWRGQCMVLDYALLCKKDGGLEGGICNFLKTLLSVFYLAVIVIGNIFEDR